MKLAQSNLFRIQVIEKNKFGGRGANEKRFERNDW